MAENITLATPVARPSITSYRVTDLYLSFGGQKIVITLTNDVGETLRHSVVGSTAVDLMKALNKANLSTKSLQRRVLELLIADGVIEGTISGTVD